MMAGDDIEEQHIVETIEMIALQLSEGRAFLAEVLQCLTTPLQPNNTNAGASTS